MFACTHLPTVQMLLPSDTLGLQILPSRKDWREHRMVPLQFWLVGCRCFLVSELGACTCGWLVWGCSSLVLWGCSRRVRSSCTTAHTCYAHAAPASGAARLPL
jgi:hypothetical protein